MGDVDSIDLRIHSPGGSVLDGWAIANGLKNHPAHVRGRVEGLAASMGSVVLMSCDEIEVPKNGYVMIHNVSGGAFGEADELESMAALMRKLQDDVADFYAEASGKDREEIVEMMAAETWMNGEDAVANGFATRVIEPVKVAACADVVLMEAKFQNMPEDLAAEMELEEAEEVSEEEVSDEEAEELQDELEEEVMGVWDRILAKLPGGSGAGAGQSSAKAALAKVTSLEADLSAKAEELASVRNELDGLRAEKEKLESAALTVEAKLIECGFDFAEASDLPAPNAGISRNVLEQYEAMPSGEERRKFLKDHAGEIRQLQRERVQGE